MLSGVAGNEMEKAGGEVESAVALPDDTKEDPAS